MAAIIVRPSTDADLPAITAIYGWNVLNGLGTFEEIPPDAAEMGRRRASFLDRGRPYLVAERDGTVVGYAYAGPFRLRAAYRYTVEDSVYVSPAAVGQGVGKALLAFADPVLVETICERPLKPVGPRTITSPELLRRELARVRNLGLAFDQEESGPGVACVASPILRTDGSASAAVSVSGWSGRMNLRRMGPAVRAVALALSRELHKSGSAGAAL